jgi:hypothetical protein
MTRIKLNPPSRLKPKTTIEEEVKACLERLSLIPDPGQRRRALLAYERIRQKGGRARFGDVYRPDLDPNKPFVIEDIPLFVQIESLRAEEMLPPPKKSRGRLSNPGTYRAQVLTDWEVYEAVQKILQTVKDCRAVPEACAELANVRSLKGKDPASRFRKAYGRHRKFHGCSDKTHP